MHVTCVNFLSMHKGPDGNSLIDFAANSHGFKIINQLHNYPNFSHINDRILDGGRAAIGSENADKPMNTHD